MVKQYIQNTVRTVEKELKVNTRNENQLRELHKVRQIRCYYRRRYVTIIP